MSNIIEDIANKFMAEGEYADTERVMHVIRQFHENSDKGMHTDSIQEAESLGRSSSILIKNLSDKDLAFALQYVAKLENLLNTACANRMVKKTRDAINDALQGK